MNNHNPAAETVHQSKVYSVGSILPSKSTFQKCMVRNVCHTLSKGRLQRLATAKVRAYTCLLFQLCDLWDLLLIGKDVLKCPTVKLGKPKLTHLPCWPFLGPHKQTGESKNVGTSSICHSKGSIIRRPNLPQRLWLSVVSTVEFTVLWSMEKFLTNINCSKTYISEYLGISENVPTPENELIVGCKAQMRRMSSRRRKKRRQRKRSSKRNSSHFRILCSPITVK